MGKYWTLPEQNAEGYIEASNEVLGVLNLTDPLSNVELEAKIIPINEGQKWYRETANENGWFMITNPYSKKVLTMTFDFWTNIYATIIDGNYSVYFICETFFLTYKE